MADSFRLFQVAGITVYLHWSWFLIALLELNFRNRFQNQLFNVAEYLTLFAIVLAHEFGHALACRSVGGRAERIMLWPLGGVAYVAPPPRPGAWLWSIAAGPLVNVALVPILFVLYLLVNGVPGVADDVPQFVWWISEMNFVLLAFNLFPAYPLDGGQMLYALLWFVIGRVAALRVAAGIGLVCAALLVLAGLGFYYLRPEFGWFWLVVVGLFMASRAWVGFGQARKMEQLLAAPHRTDRACPACGHAPIIGPMWGCSQCGGKFDTFAENGVCPQCGAKYDETACGACGRRSPISRWEVAGR